MVGLDRPSVGGRSSAGGICYGVRVRIPGRPWGDSVCGADIVRAMRYWFFALGIWVGCASVDVSASDYDGQATLTLVRQHNSSGVQSESVTRWNGRERWSESPSQYFGGGMWEMEVKHSGSYHTVSVTADTGGLEGLRVSPIEESEENGWTVYRVWLMDEDVAPSDWGTGSSIGGTTSPRVRQDWIFVVGEDHPMGADVAIVATGLDESTLDLGVTGEELVLEIYEDVMPGDTLVGYYDYVGNLLGSEELSLEMRLVSLDGEGEATVIADGEELVVTGLDVTGSVSGELVASDVSQMQPSGAYDDGGNPIYTLGGVDPSSSGGAEVRHGGGGVGPADTRTGSRPSGRVATPGDGGSGATPLDDYFRESGESEYLGDITRDGVPEPGADDDEVAADAESRVLNWYGALETMVSDRLDRLPAMLGDLIRYPWDLRPEFTGVGEDFEVDVMGQSYRIEFRTLSVNLYDMLGGVFVLSTALIVYQIATAGVEEFRGVVRALGATSQVQIGSGNALGAAKNLGFTELAVAGAIFVGFVSVFFALVLGGFELLAGTIDASDFDAEGVDLGEVWTFFDGVLNLTGIFAALPIVFVIRQTGLFSTITGVVMVKLYPALS